MTTVAEKSTTKDKKAERKAISLEAFKKKYLEKITYKYEWKNGQVEKEEYIKASERYIINNIIRKHIPTEQFQQGNSIVGEADCFFSTIASYRRPDATYLNPRPNQLPRDSRRSPCNHY